MLITWDTNVVAGQSHGKALMATISPLVHTLVLAPFQRIIIMKILCICCLCIQYAIRLIQYNLELRRTFYQSEIEFAGTTILAAVKNTVDPTTKVIYSQNPNTNFVKSGEFDYAIVVVGEKPYAEGFGDSTNLTIAEPGPSTIENVCASVKCVVVVVSGRPVVMQPYISNIDALVAAWLPGTEGQGVADVLFGDYGFTGKLARTWFKTVDQLPMNVGDPHYDPLYPFGFGLITKPN